MTFGLPGIDPLDRLISDYAPVFGLLLVLILAAVLFWCFTRGTTAMGDYLDVRGTFDLAISRRPRTRAAARRYQWASRHPAPRVSTFRALVVLGVLALGLALIVAWFIYGLYVSVAPPG